MKVVAIILNLALLITVSVLFVSVRKDRAPSVEDIFMFLLFFAAPIASLLALLFSGGDTWVGLYLQRKRLEERRKIAKLEDPDA